jgi:glycosyltransferase involved in cell wall biosynthesis
VAVPGARQRIACPPVRVAYTLEQCWHDVPGGTAVAALAVARHLPAEGVEPIGVAARHRTPPPAPWTPSIPVRHLPLPRPLLYDAWLRLGWPAAERASGPVEVVHATTIVVPPRRARPLIVTIHDLAFVHDPSQFSRRGVATFRRALARVRERADLVLCSSHATLDDCADAGLSPDRLRHVPLGIDAPAPLTEAAIEAARRRHGLPEHYLLFVGTLEPRKNLPRLVEAHATLPAAPVLAIAGPNGWGSSGGGAGTPVADPARVRLLGFVPEADKQALYSGAAAVCYPSIREGFGLPVLEAMARGAPVVTSRGTATEEAAGGAAVLVDPLDIGDIARGIEEALGRAGELAARGPIRAAQCTWAATAAATAAAYREVAG